jgi:hypothetical protein
VQRERPLHADAEGLLADRERLADAVALALDHDALEHLGAASRALDHLEVDAQAVARVELGDAPQLCAFEAVDDGAHEVVGEIVSGVPAARRSARRTPGAADDGSGSTAAGVLVWR